MLGIQVHFDLPNAVPDIHDPPLAEDVEKFACGAGVDDVSPFFAQWVEALARIRVQAWWFHGL